MQSILLVDDQPANLIALEVALEDLVEEFDLELVTCESGIEGLKALMEGNFSLVLCDIQMPEMDGYEVAKLMKQNKQHRNIPVIFLTAINKDFNNVLQGYESGAIDFLFKPFEPVILKSKVRVLLEMDLQQKAIQKLQKQQQSILASVGEGIVCLSSEGDIEFCNPFACNLLNINASALVGAALLDVVELNDDDGEAIIQWRNTRIYKHCLANKEPLVIQAKTKKHQRENGEPVTVEMTATAITMDTRGKEFSGCVLVFNDVTERIKKDQYLNYLAERDPLTGIFNRRSFENHLETTITACQEHGAEFALLYIDLDRFKGVNDTLGHDIGDKLLKAIAEQFQHSFRASDKFYRLGGDEFGVIIRSGNKNEKPVEKLAQDVCVRLTDIMDTLNEIDGSPVDVGISIGVAIFPRHGATAQQLINAADEQMYKAKKIPTNSFEVSTTTIFN